MRCLFVSIIVVICVQCIKADVYNIEASKLKGLTKEELDVLHDAVKRQGRRFLSEFQASATCEEMTCNLCIGFELAQVPHELCLSGGLLPEELTAFISLQYDQFEIWGHRFSLNKICTGLPKPLHNVTICLEAYHVDFSNFPQEGGICLRTELTLLIPLLSIDFNCIRYDLDYGIYFDYTIESESKALIDININGGMPIVSFNSEIPWLLIKPILMAIQKEREKYIEVQHDLVAGIKKDLNKGDFWGALVGSIAAGGTMGMGVRSMDD